MCPYVQQSSLKIISMGIFSNLFGGPDKIIKKEIHYSASETSRIKSILDSRQFEALKNVTHSDFGSRMDVTYKRNRQYASVQLFDYIPYSYEERSPLYEFTGGEAEAFLSSML